MTLRQSTKIISMIEWIRTSRSSIKNSLSSSANKLSFVSPAVPRLYQRSPESVWLPVHTRPSQSPTKPDSGLCNVPIPEPELEARDLVNRVSYHVNESRIVTCSYFISSCSQDLIKRGMYTHKKHLDQVCVDAVGYSLSLSLSFSRFLSLFLSLSLFCSLSISLSLSLSDSLTHTLSLSLSIWLSLYHPPTHTHTDLDEVCVDAVGRRGGAR